jgi:hypothetical protein
VGDVVVVVKERKWYCCFEKESWMVELEAACVCERGAEAYLAL